MIYMYMHFTDDKDDKETASDSRIDDPDVLQPNNGKLVI